MKKKFLLLPLSLLFIASCNNSPINVPKSPFSDTYQRIGMKSQYNYNLSSLTSVKQYEGIDKALNDEDTIKENENKVSSYTIHEEYRDLEYAYFGKESSSVSRCRMTSKNDVEQRYDNRVKIGTTTLEDQIQTANSGIYKTNSTTIDYTFDVNYNGELPKTDSKYCKVTKTGSTITEDPETQYDPSTEGIIDTLYGLTPMTSHIIKPFTSEFKLFGDNCVYGSFNNGKNYLIKEGYSKFGVHMTKSGRKYITSRNYFYEGILDSGYKLTDFRYYTEQLILSEAWDGESIPILYLDKPELINFTETKYKINYDTPLPEYHGSIPRKG